MHAYVFGFKSNILCVWERELLIITYGNLNGRNEE